jgi:hypothetical protein
MTDRKLNCVGCHTPIQRTGQSPVTVSALPMNPNVGAANLSFRWAPIFSDMLLHTGPVIDAERFATQPRDPVVIQRRRVKNNLKDDDKDDGAGRTFATFDIPRNLADDTFSTFKAIAKGEEFRTAPLMGLGRMGPPFLHDARVFLSRLTVDKAPAGTVMTSSEFTNAPLIVRTVDDAIRAAIELHDLPAPDDSNTPNVAGAGCPVPPVATNISYGTSPANVICPAYDSDVSRNRRGEAREVIRRFRSLSPADQQALIEFLKQL